MRKIVLVNTWEIIEQKSRSGKKPEFSVIITDAAISAKPIQIRVPYSSITDTTISPDTHELFLDMDPIRNTGNKIQKSNIFFREKSEQEEGGTQNTSEFTNTSVGATFGTRVKKKRKALIGNDGTSISVSDKGAAIGAPGKETLFGKNGVMMLSGSPTIPSLPEQDHLLFKETGIGRLMPKAFIPPFCIPSFLPTLQAFTQVAGVVGILKSIDQLTRNTF